MVFYHANSAFEAQKAPGDDRSCPSEFEYISIMQTRPALDNLTLDEVYWGIAHPFDESLTNHN
jgi:hypothetical protein